MSKLLGIHHITALASDPQQNVDFYTKTLGLKLVKQTVNYDDPGTYHLYYGDNTGSPGTILTFFPYANAARGKRGPGQIIAVAYSIAPSSVSFWAERLSRLGISFEGPRARFDEEVISFEDPDGMVIELVAHVNNNKLQTFDAGFIPSEHALRAFWGVTINSMRTSASLKLLTETIQFATDQKSDNRTRLTVGEGISRASIDILHANSDRDFGSMSAGSVHHIAWRVADMETQAEWRDKLVKAGQNVTPVVDRNYFHSIYYREPGGVLYEIATDQPGFAIDEPVNRLGEWLCLPPWLEQDRAKIVKRLQPIVMPTKKSVAL